MYQESVRIVVTIPSGVVEVTNAGSIPSLFELVKQAIPEENSLRRFSSAKIKGNSFTGEARGALVVGDCKESQLEYVEEGKEYAINGSKDLQKLVVVSSDASPIENVVVVLQF